MVAIVNRNSCRITIACNNPASVIAPTTCGDLIGIGRGTDNELLIPLAANLNPAYTIAFPRGFNFGGTPYAFLKMSSVNLNNINSNGEIIVPVDATALDEGTIDFYYRENGLPTQEEIDDEEDIIGT